MLVALQGVWLFLTLLKGIYGENHATLLRSCDHKKHRAMSGRHTPCNFCD